jgi:hypothetical protein
MCYRGLNSFAAYTIAQIWPPNVTPLRDCIRLIVRQLNICDKMMIMEAWTGRRVERQGQETVLSIGTKCRESYYTGAYDREDDNPMWLACEHGNVEIVRHMAPYWQIDESCLLVAAYRGHVDTVAWILDTRWRVLFDTTDEGEQLRMHETKHLGFYLHGLNKTVDAGVRKRGGDPVRQRPRDPMLQWLFDNGYTTYEKITAGTHNGGGLMAMLALAYINNDDPRDYERDEVQAWRAEQGLPSILFGPQRMLLATEALNERIKEIIASREESSDDLLK